MNDVVETKTQKVNAMLAMRKLVKDHVTGKNRGNVKHLGELKLDDKDNTRLIISLQDLADDERGRRIRAQKHIISLIQIKNDLKDRCIEISNAAYESGKRLQDAIAHIRAGDDQIAKLNALLAEKDQQINALVMMIGKAGTPAPMPVTNQAVGGAQVQSNRHPTLTEMMRAK